MLPGFRFLFTAIVLSLSILVFGLGAAALLRAAHEEFASNPSWHAAPETTFAQQGEAATPVLALMRLDAHAVDTAKIENPSGDVPAALASPAEQAAMSSAPAEPEKVAALNPEASSPPEPAKPAIPAAEIPAQSEAAPAPADAPATVDPTKIATAAETLPAANEAAPAAAAVAPVAEAAPAAAEPTPAAASPGSGVAATKIATLGGPPVTIEPQPSGKAASAKPDRGVVERRLQARRAALRRRMAARARLAARQALLQQQAANPFLQPAIQPGVQPAIQPTNR
jgi:hypothetical protein